MKAEYIDHMGDDLRVANAARVSFDKESDWDYEEFTGVDEHGAYEDARTILKPGDVKLIRYLATHNHFTPFTHSAITLRETIPIFVARQRFKHTVGFSYNEVSRRYVDSPPEFYTPTEWRKRAENKKQGSSDEVISERQVPLRYSDYLLAAENLYDYMIDEGVAPEQARMVLPQSMYTSFYVTGSLAAFARAYKLRRNGEAQKEIQELAEHWDKIIRPLFPVSWEALVGS